ncbi:MAG TPA: protein kinase [Pseudomonadota bacterium]|nr:protein kinase [Pseudomonadota bacterium]
MSEGRDSEQPAADGAAASSNQAATRPMAPPSPQASTERLGQDPAAGMLDGELPIGGVLADRYQVLQRLSAGGMGVVYKAKHLALDDIVAIKLLLKPQDETDRKRFLLEARLATRIKHPNTVYVSDFGLLPDGRSYLVMEFMPGQTLSQALKGGKLEPLRACRIAVQIARGLQAVHDLDIVHRDLKPDNIFLLTQDGQPDFVKIVDFGIAKASQLPASLALELPPGVAAPQAGELAAASPTVQLHELAATARNMTMKSAILGTPHYMSPEAIKGKAVDGRADQYALGCVLFQLLSGRLPFREDDLMALLTQHMYEPIPELRLEAPEVPAPLAEIVKKLLAKEPAARYGSMRDVEHALEREIELIMIQRGERAVVSSALAGLLKVQGKGLRAAVMLGGRAVPLWALGPVALLLLVGGAGLGVRFFAPGVGVIKESLRPGELRELRGRALAVLREDLKSGPEALKVGSALVLGQSHDRELRPELEALLRSPSPALRGQAAEGLGQLGDRQLTPVLLTFLEHEQAPQARLGAALALQQLGEPSGAMELDKLLGSGSAQVQLRAALARCEHLPDSARTVLHGFLPRPELPGGARLAILACLGRLGDAEAVAALRSQAQAGVRPAERIAAQVKLAELGDFAAHAALQQLIQRRGPD